jgi:fido (protein-threonine AMPylation protein)
VIDSDPYIYPGSTVLRNKLGITDPAELDYVERELVAQRAAEGIPTGRFDLAHLQDIHGDLFQDVYDWAGQLRTVEISKGGHQFQFRQFIETGMADVHGRLEKARFLKNLGQDEFARSAGVIIGDINYVHPRLSDATRPAKPGHPPPLSAPSCILPKPRTAKHSRSTIREASRHQPGLLRTGRTKDIGCQ